MSRKALLFILLVPLLLAACETPDPVEVTREIEVTRIVSSEVEVTVEVEVTRVVTETFEVEVEVTRGFEVTQEPETPEQDVFADEEWADAEVGKFESFIFGETPNPGECIINAGGWLPAGQSVHWRSPLEALSVEITYHDETTTAISIQYFANQILPNWQAMESEMEFFFNEKPFAVGDSLGAAVVTNAETGLPEGNLLLTSCRGQLYVRQSINYTVFPELVDYTSTTEYACSEEDLDTPLGEWIGFNLMWAEDLSRQSVDLYNDRMETINSVYDLAQERDIYGEVQTTPLEGDTLYEIHFKGGRGPEKYVKCDGYWYDLKMPTEDSVADGFTRARFAPAMCPATSEFQLEGKNVAIWFYSQDDLVILDGMVQIEDPMQIRDNEMLVLELEGYNFHPQLAILSCDGYLHTSHGFFLDFEALEPPRPSA